MELARHDGGQAGQLVDELREVYAAVFTGPPFLEPAERAELFAQELRSELGAPGFACYTAREAGRLLGFIYGYVAEIADPPSDWELRLLGAVGPGAADRWIRGQFAVAWFAIRPELQGCGIGSRLYDLLLRTTDGPRAWLVTHDLESPARAFYRRRGWRELGRGALGWGREERLVLGLERRTAPSADQRSAVPRRP
jgi:GNAT superfamily N-acetyltransferase